MAIPNFDSTPSNYTLPKAQEGLPPAIVKDRDRGIGDRDEDRSSYNDCYCYATDIYVQLEELSF